MKHFVIATVARRLDAVPRAGCGRCHSACADRNPLGQCHCRRSRGQGHHVQINGSTSGPLSLCKATGVHGLNDSNRDSSGNRIDEDQFSTIYVDVVCPNP
jgi:hypothetical protein